ncbi:DNA-directed DNA polymerase [Methanoplanus limicola]|uniref:DNA polymerase n=1 Tax=Methanoplanus limicola DSM 2279 TaxID=937775 RepID=H1Z3S7_9EURY|nr:DNA-directed DNA polymerase [Methanoplanus limicola]EHQ35676.1 replicative DNA polymerase I [Methanoplanus limicola DSM 2279]
MQQSLFTSIEERIQNDVNRDGRSNSRPENKKEIKGLNNDNPKFTAEDAGVKNPDEINIAINQVEYSNEFNGSVVHIFGREESGKARHIQVTGFRPYFYAPKEAVQEAWLPGGYDRDLSGNYISIQGEKLGRIITAKPGDVREFREGFKHFEADIPFATRFMIDNGLTGGVSVKTEITDYREITSSEVNSPARVCIIDIECEDERGFPDANRERINCITCWDSYDNEYQTFVWLINENGPETVSTCNNCHKVVICGNEKDLLKRFIAYIAEKDPDVLSGWNFTDFDMPYIQKRIEVLGVSDEGLSRLPGGPSARNPVRGRAVFDLLTGYKKMQGGRKESYRLDAIAEEEIGEGKIRYTGTVSDLWKYDPNKLIEYNVKDVELCVGINNKNKIVEFYREIARYVGCPLDRTLNSSNVIDIFVLRKAYGKYILPSKGYADAEEFEGATVFDPSKGVKENVIVLDLKSLYPMCMMTINASPETKDKNGELRAPNGIRFRKEPDGLTRSIISDLLKERDERKAERNNYDYGSPEYELYDIQQNVLKVIMNTYYGVSGYARFRLYDRDIGSAVTSVGRAIIEHTRKIIEGMGYAVIYGDTDSCMVNLPVMEREETIKTARKIEERLNESYSEFSQDVLNAESHYFSIKFEKIYERFFQAGKKKRYAGYLVWKEGKEVDQIDIVGFEMKRSDSPHITKEVQLKVMDLILKGADKSELKNYLGAVIKTYRKGGYTLDDVGIPGGIGKELLSYENKDAHIRGAIYSNENLGTDFKRGSKPKRVYIKTVTAKYQKTDVLCFEYADQVPNEFIIDWETMLDKTIKQPISRIIEAIGIPWDEVDPSRTTLFDFGM